MPSPEMVETQFAEDCEIFTIDGAHEWTIHRLVSHSGREFIRLQPNVWIERVSYDDADEVLWESVGKMRGPYAPELEKMWQRLWQREGEMRTATLE